MTQRDIGNHSYNSVPLNNKDTKETIKIVKINKLAEKMIEPTVATERSSV